MTSEPTGAGRPKVGKRKTTAAGVPAVVRTLRHTLTEMGLVRTVRTLRRMNHIDGFDCPSCAWPDPERRKAAGFCENGATAVAWEASRKRVGREFFAANPIAQLREQPDHWLEHIGRLNEPMSHGLSATL